VRRMNNKTILIKNAEIINEGESFTGSILITGEFIEKIFKENEQLPDTDLVIDAANCYLIPGVIDDHVHFREPGMTYKGDIETESKAAIAGGITSFMEMPNTIPQTTTIEELENKFDIASKKSFANYSFYIGATNNNLKELLKINPENVCGVKIFMGSSTGNMLVNDKNNLSTIFKEVNMIIATHCEDDSIIKANTEKYRKEFGEEIPFRFHPLIRSEEACYRSSSIAVELAEKYNSRLHILHLSTERELSLLKNDIPLENKRITGEACINYLWFDDSFYNKLGWKIKSNPAIKTVKDREALRNAVINGKIDVIATDHAPHTIEEKNQSYLKSPSGCPLIQHSLSAMLELAEQGIFSREKIIEKMCHNPAKLFRINKRGFIREGYYADIVLVKKGLSWKAENESSLYKCKWTPFAGTAFSNMITHTFVNGYLAYENGKFNRFMPGKQLKK